MEEATEDITTSRDRGATNHQRAIDEVPQRDAAASHASSGGIPAVRTPMAAAGAAIQLVPQGTAAVAKALIDIGKDGMNAAAHIHKQPGVSENCWKTHGFNGYNSQI